MADQDLKLNVTATATGDGLRKTAEEVKNLNAETAKSAPIALEAKTREEQLAAVRERHAEAARAQAAAEAELDAKRAASPFFNGQAPAIAGPPAEGGGAGDSLLGVGVAGGLAGAAAAASAMLAKEAIDGLMNITTRMEEARLETEKMSNALKAQADAWLEQAQAVRSRGDLLKFQRDVRVEIEATELKMRDLQHSTGSWVDQWKLWADANGEGSLTGKALSFIETKREREIAQLRQRAEAHKAASDPEIALSQKLLRELEAIEKLPDKGKLDALGEAMMEMQTRQAGFLKDSEGYNYWAVRMEEVEKRTAAVTAEIEKGTAARQKEGEALDANMRKEGEKFAQLETQRVRAEEAEQRERARLQREGDAIEDAMERERQKNAQQDAREAARAAEKEQRERQKEVDRDARDRARIEDEESRWRTKHNIQPPGTASAGPVDSFREAFPTAPGGGDAVAAAQSQTEALRELGAIIRAQMRAAQTTRQVVAEVKSQSEEHS
jgi:hypothetical protein